MGNSKQPTITNGKICYLEIPAVDVLLSASFYKKVFGWQISERGDGMIAFNDTVNEVSGTWIVGRIPSTETGILVYIMVDSVISTIKSIITNGGKIVQSEADETSESTARFTDPAGNIFGIFQEHIQA
jgi:uncharacterized protein